MFKIKLLILLLANLIISSCVVANKPSKQYTLGYIGGGVDGLIYSNILTAQLESFGIFNKNSSYQVNTSISHDQELYITNINKTSDRERIISSIKTEVLDLNQNCIIFRYDKKIKQFYVIAANINFTSNQKAIETIKRKNSEILSKDLIYKLIELNNTTCNE